MSHGEIAKTYLVKARVRLEALGFCYGREAHSDVVREAQEVVEIALKGILWHIGVEPPKIHDVGRLILEGREELPDEVGRLAGELVRVHGDVDLVPTAEYGPDQAKQAIDDARLVIEATARCVDPA